MTPEDVLARIAGVLRHSVGPEVDDEFARTQVYMAAVVLEKVAGQIRSDARHRQADIADGVALKRDLDELLGDGAPPALRVALYNLGGASDTQLGAFVTALYDHRVALGAERFSVVLARVRTTLRSRLDRELEYSA